MQFISCISPKRWVSGTPTCTIRSPWFKHWVISLCIGMHTKRSTELHPKVIPSGVKQNMSSRSVHPFHATTFTINRIWVNTRIFLLFLECTSSGHSPFEVFFSTLGDINGLWWRMKTCRNIEWLYEFYVWVINSKWINWTNSNKLWGGGSKFLIITMVIIITRGFIIL